MLSTFPPLVVLDRCIQHSLIIQRFQKYVRQFSIMCSTNSSFNFVKLLFLQCSDILHQSSVMNKNLFNAGNACDNIFHVSQKKQRLPFFKTVLVPLVSNLRSTNSLLKIATMKLSNSNNIRRCLSDLQSYLFIMEHFTLILL